MHDYLPIVDRDGFYTCASGGLGHGMPAAIGIALGRPDKKVIALLGDDDDVHIKTLDWSRNFRGQLLTTEWILLELADGMANTYPSFSTSKFTGRDTASPSPRAGPFRIPPSGATTE